MERDTVFSTIADGANTPVARIGREAHWAEDILVRARVDGERIDGQRRSGPADVSISEVRCRAIQRPRPGGIGSDCSRSPDIRGLLSVRRRQWVKEGRQGGRLVGRLHEGREMVERETKERWRLESKGRRGERKVL